MLTSETAWAFDLSIVCGLPRASIAGKNLVHAFFVDKILEQFVEQIKTINSKSTIMADLSFPSPQLDTSKKDSKKDLLVKIKKINGLTNAERAELVKLLNESKEYGLIWEDKPEAAEELLRTKLPVLREVVERRITSESESVSGRTSFTELENEQNNTVELQQNSLLFEGKENIITESLPQNTYPNHILIEGDNLHALTALSFTHEGKIDIIYIDPPYNTGNKDKEGKTDFKYNDDYIDKEDTYRHSKWLSFMDKRLRIAKKLLSINGFLAISIDDNEIAQLKILLDKIFNGNTKIIVVKMSEASGLKMSSVYKLGIIPKYKEYLILAKATGIKGFKFDNISKGKWDSEYNIYLEDFEFEDRLIINDISSKDEINDNDILKLDEIAKRINLKSVSDKHQSLGLKNKKEKEKFNFDNAWRICQCATSSSVLRLADEKKKINKNPLFFVRSVRDGKLYFVRATYSTESSKPRVQLIFADENLSTHPGDFWFDIKTTGLEAEGGVGFKNGKKPLKLLTKILKANENKNSTILDFFAGSGSTLHAALELNSLDNGNRKVILATNNENGICQKTTYKRAQNVILGYNTKSSMVRGYGNNNLRYYQVDFVDSAKTEVNRRKLTVLSTNLLQIKEDCYSDITESEGFDHSKCSIQSNEHGKYMVVIYHSRSQIETTELLSKWIAARTDLSDKVKIYAFGHETEIIADDFYAVADKIDAVPLPDAIYNAYRATFRTLKLDKKPPVNFVENQTLAENENE